MKKLILVLGVIVFGVFAAPAMAHPFHPPVRPHTYHVHPLPDYQDKLEQHPQPHPKPPVTDDLCPDGLPHDAGKDGQVPYSGNTNDDCDHSVAPPPVETTVVVTPVPPVATPSCEVSAKRSVKTLVRTFVHFKRVITFVKVMSVSEDCVTTTKVKRYLKKVLIKKAPVKQKKLVKKKPPVLDKPKVAPKTL